MSNQCKETLVVQEPVSWGVDPTFVQIPAKATNEEHKKKQVAAAMYQDSYGAARPAREDYYEQQKAYQDSLGSDDDTDDAEEIEPAIIDPARKPRACRRREEEKHESLAQKHVDPAMKPLQNSGVIVEESKNEQPVAIPKEDSQDALYPVIEEHAEDHVAIVRVDGRRHSTELNQPKEEELPVSVQDYSQQLNEEESEDRQPSVKESTSFP